MRKCFDFGTCYTDLQQLKPPSPILKSQSYSHRFRSSLNNHLHWFNCISRFHISVRKIHWISFILNSTFYLRRPLKNKNNINKKYYFKNYCKSRRTQGQQYFPKVKFFLCNAFVWAIHLTSCNHTLQDLITNQN